MRAAALDAPADACRHCRQTLAGRYCHRCGEDAIPPETGLHAWRTTLDRVIRTLRALWFEPGRLASEHLNGIRIGFVPPWTLFINAVAVFFVFSAVTQFQLITLTGQNAPWMQPLVDAEAAARGISPERLIERAERRFQGMYTLSLALISGAGYTLVYRLLYRRALDGWRGAFTLALNYLAFLFTMFLPWMIALEPLRRMYGGVAVMALTLTALAIAVVWNAGAARRIAGHRWPAAVGLGLAVMIAGVFIDSAMTVVAIYLTLKLA